MKKKVNKKINPRAMEIFRIFATHNFYFNGLTPFELRTTIEDLGPTYVKIGQIMSSRNDILPEEYCRELEKLRSDVVPIEIDEVKAIIEAETGCRIEDLYSEFREKPLGSASMGQAHFGILKDGRRVVTKVQRPGIEEKMLEDLKLLKSLAGYSQAGIDPDEPRDSSNVNLIEVLDELEKVTIEELDYGTEAANTKEFHELCIEEGAMISSPEIIEELSTKRILTMTYVPGDTLSDLNTVEKHGHSRQEAAEALFDHYIHQVFEVGLFHADPHQGNIMVDDEKIYWIDFGMLGRISSEKMNGLKKMILAMMQGNADDLVGAVLSLGVSNGKVDKAALIEDVREMMEEQAGAGQLSEVNFSALSDTLQNIMADHNLKLPREYTLLIRSLITMEGVIEELYPDIDMAQVLAKKLLSGSDVAKRLMEMIGILMPGGEFTKNLPMSVIKLLLTSGTQVANLPSSAVKLVNNVADGRLKIKLELTGYEGIMETVVSLAVNLVLALFACILFIGGCILTTADVQPAVSGMPVVSIAAFVVSIALGMFTVTRFRKQRTNK
ncbi:MAG: AarF/UbiB family protein [Lachnospiraceae bacterium]|nr:AarF/UbiB family protein [Lachnospiraceae bacterium]